jgi:MFS family permease
MTTQIVAPGQAINQAPAQGPGLVEEKTLFRVLIAVGLGHLLNDSMQALLPSIYPILKTSFHLNFGQIGLLTLTYQMTASILQPFIGQYTDRKPLPYSLPVGMVFTLLGLLLLSVAPSFAFLLLAAGAGTEWLSRSFRWAEIVGRRSVRCWQLSSSFLTGSAGRRGSLSWLCWDSCF